MAIALEAAKTIYRHAVDPRASEGESSAWWNEVADEVREVVAARSLNEAAEVIQWRHHDWTAVCDTPHGAAKRIRAAARAIRLRSNPKETKNVSTQAESVAVQAMAEKIERLERELASKQSAPHLPSQLGDFARILRSHGIAKVFHAGKIDSIDGGTAAESLRGAVEQFGRREHLTPECQARLVKEISGSLFDVTDGFDAVKKAQVHTS